VTETASPLPRLGIVLSHPTQYYSPWFQWLKARTPLEFRVFYLWNFGVTVQRDPRFQTAFRWDVDLLSGYDHEFVPNRSAHPGPERFGGFDNPTLGRRLSDWRPGAILLYGYKWRTHVGAIAWARRRRVPVLFRGDSHLIGRPAPRLAARILLRLLFGQFAACLCVGKANREYFKAFGVPDRKLVFAPHSVNRELFEPSNPATVREAAALRLQLGLAPATRVVLFAGKLNPAKQPRELLSAFLGLDRRDAALVFVGDGEEKEALRALAAGAPAGAVHFLPFANQTEMPSRYALADLFALPSKGLYETWGLAVNEAMHMGVPALVSDRVGCQRDLVDDGETGWVFRAEDPADLRRQLGRALDTLGDESGRARIKAAAIERISHYTYEQTTSGLLDALAALNPA
jgi:glycosyltransferase involved in cell wall biosynthesis